MADNNVSVPGIVPDTLAVIAAREGYRKPRFFTEVGSRAGDGYTSVVYRAIVRDEDPTGRSDELNLMCKTAISGTTVQFSGLIFGTEGCMYETVLPAMETIAKMTEPYPWPRCMYVSVEDPAKPILVMEDLRPSGYFMAPRHQPMTVQHCRAALSQLARYHGAGLALKHLDPNFFQGMIDTLGCPYGTKQMQETYQQFLTTLDNAQDLVQERFPKGSAVYDKLKKLYSAFIRNFFDLARVEEGDPGSAMVHGDCHVNNMLFKYDKVSGDVTGCRLIDFQASRYGCTTWDLGSLLLPCTDKSLRDKHWNELLRGYHTELQTVLRTAGCENPDDIYSYPEFLDRMRLGAQFGLCMAPMLVHAMIADEQAVEELHRSIKDIDKEKAFIIQIKPTPELKERLADLVQDMVDWGWL